MKSGNKTVSVGTKLTESEAGLFRDLATARGADSSALIRELVLREIGDGSTVVAAVADGKELAARVERIARRLQAVQDAFTQATEESIERGKHLTLERFREICDGAVTSCA